MELIKTEIADCWVVIPKVFKDERGYFFESFHQKRFQKLTNISFNPIQDNQAFSSFGVIRGLHFQKGPAAQAKLVRALQGTILDVVLDIRKNSSSYGKVVTRLLSQENKEQLFVPKGCAHGYAALSKQVVLFYKTDAYYNPEAEAGILFNDTDLGIDWQIPEKDQVLSQKDLLWPTFKKLDCE